MEIYLPTIRQRKIPSYLWEAINLKEEDKAEPLELLLLKKFNKFH